MHGPAMSVARMASHEDSTGRHMCIHVEKDIHHMNMKPTHVYSYVCKLNSLIYVCTYIYSLSILLAVIHIYLF